MLVNREQHRNARGCPSPNLNLSRLSAFEQNNILVYLIDVTSYFVVADRIGSYTCKVLPVDISRTVVSDQ
jgi:hypothetical protein